MIIDKTAFEQMIDHMKVSAPREGVGVLAGLNAFAACPNDTNGDGDCGRRLCPHCSLLPDVRGPSCDRWVPLANVSDFPVLRYEVDDAELLATWTRLEAVGYRPRIMCHSHTRSNAAPSDLDIVFAVDPTVLHLVVSLENPLSPVPKLWRLNPEATGVDRVVKVLFEVVDLGFRTVGNSDLTRRVTGA